MQSSPSSARRILLSALAAMTVSFGVVSLIDGFSDSVAVRLLQGLAVFGLGAAIVGGAVVLALVRLAGWRDPESEREFEALVQRSERLAAGEEWDGLEDWDPEIAEDEDGDEDEAGRFDGEAEFRALVHRAVEELPLEFHRALEHVA